MNTVNENSYKQVQEFATISSKTTKIYLKNASNEILVPFVFSYIYINQSDKLLEQNEQANPT